MPEQNREEQWRRADKELRENLPWGVKPAALGSDWVGLERSIVLFRDPSNAGRRFIPFLLAACGLPGTPRRNKHENFRRTCDLLLLRLLSGQVNFEEN